MPSNKKKAPLATKKTVTLTTLGRKRTDHYFWLKERENPAVMAYLEAENIYTQEMMNDTEEFQELLYQEIVTRIKQEDQSVPVFKNGFFYYTRYISGGEYPLICRRQNTMTAPEEIMLDGNEMANGHAYFNIGSYQVSPDNQILAFCVDTVGRWSYTIYFKNLQTGQIVEDGISNTGGSLAWADDSRTIYYTLKNLVTLRSEKVMLHIVFSNQEDQVFYEEKDEAFLVDVHRSKSEKMIFVSVHSTVSSEYLFVNSALPTGELCLVQPRARDLEYDVEHDGDSFYIITNYQAKNFRLMKTNVKTPTIENWIEIIPHRQDVLLVDIDVFQDFLVVSERSNGLNQIHIFSKNGEEHYLRFDEDDYLAFVMHTPTYNTDRLRFFYSSLTTPISTIEYNMCTRTKILLKQQEILGGYSADDYTAQRLFSPAPDGKKIPISLVYKKNTILNGKTPLLLYGYGAYGSTIDPIFSVSRISLLDRGFVFAIAHIRGGDTLGRQWYEDGKLLNKKNTFTDFIACAEYLIAEKYTDKEHLCAMGASAGGLLMGAVINMRPELFRAVVAGVPFVDVITTMCDTSIPLTTGEFDEWGNPETEDYYDYIRSYSPYDNVQAQDYPNLLVTTGLHDSQVQYWEPAKWVAKLRALKTDNNLLLLHTNMEAGHGGASGRFQEYREIALEYAFLCKMVLSLNDLKAE